MKTKKIVIIWQLIAFLLIPSLLIAQDNEQKPVYITVTKMHFNLDADGKDWLKTEKEYFDKVTSKNDLVIGAHVVTHLYTEDNTEVKFVYVYNSWSDIEKSGEVDQELIKKAWPDETKRKEYFDKRSGYYAKKHSDEIYQSMNFGKMPTVKSDKPQVFYARVSKLAMDGKGKGYNDFAKNVIHKNPLVKAYYPHRHLWGSDARDFVEVFVFDSLSDLDKSADKNNELIKAAWPDEAKRKAFFDEMNKLFTGRHADYIYQNVPELAK